MGFQRSQLVSFALGSTHYFFILFILTSFTTDGSESRAHHKVHNLALYPERHSWCQATKIRQEISHAPECYTRTIDNVVCLGACFSYSVPRAEDDPVIPPYCDACRPTISSWKVVTLNCTNPTTGEPYQLARNVEIISNCSCVDCNDNKPRSSAHGEESTENELPDSLFEHRRTNEVENNDVTGHDDDDNNGIGNINSVVGRGNGEDDDDDEGGEDEEEEEDESLKPLVPDSLPKPTLHKLKSVSEELKEFRRPAVDEESMIKDNKIPADDDHDQESARNMMHKERERERERERQRTQQASDRLEQL